MINGMINIYKEKGFTSHDVVAKLRGILKQKKIGHTGTLDPDATGVLPVCLGNGTRLCDMLADRTKEYRATMVFGIKTDTQDISGKVLESREVNITPEQAREAILSFFGVSKQIPPMYSALKVDGKKLYELARQGKSVDREAREITISKLEIVSIELPYVSFDVECSKGTYIRTLCNDIGEKLGCLGTMTELLRTRVGEFYVAEALKLSEVEALRDLNQLSEKIIPVDYVFRDLPSFTVRMEDRKWIDNGNTLIKERFQKVKDCTDGQLIRIYNDENVFCGVYRFDQLENSYRPYKMFPTKE